jgi:hypothetical protein
MRLLDSGCISKSEFRHMIIIIFYDNNHDNEKGIFSIKKYTKKDMVKKWYIKKL